MKRYLHTALLLVISMSLMSCTKDDRPQIDYEAIVARQLVIEQFGPDVWESSTNYNTFIARRPDNSVWLVVIKRAQAANRYQPEHPTMISTKTMIFNSNISPPTEKK